MPNPVTAVDDVTYQRAELTAALPRYTLVRDAVGQHVKDKGQVYLPKPSPGDLSSDNVLRYAAYVERAVFYGVTGRTLNGMVGQVYARPPMATLPALLSVMEADATGSGLSMEQLSKDTMADIMSCGRAGLYVDYPVTNATTTRAQLLDGSVRPTLTTYGPESVINWRSKRRGSKLVLDLVVLYEKVDVQGEFSTTQVEQWRELRLVPDAGGNDMYVVRVHRRNTTPVAATGAVKSVAPEPATNPQSWTITSAIPKDAEGFPFNEIPFTFVGSTNNDTAIDEAPLYDLANLNIAHYRNSADYEEACFICGQPTPWFSGLTQEWVTDVFKGEVLLGSRAAIPLPENSQAGLLQVAPNSMPFEAMKHKEVQMVALGARLVENRQVRRTASEVTQSNASETSILASCADNVSAAYTKMLGFAARFVGAAPEECKYELNTDFAMVSLSPEDRMQLIADMQAGALSFTEVRTQLRRVGVATQADSEALTEIKARAEAQAKLEADAKPQPNKIDNRAK